MIDEQADDRRQVLAAAGRCIERWSVSKVTMTDVATEAGVSRSTLYRMFPGGRDDLLESLVRCEMGDFFGALAEFLEEHSDLQSVLTDGLMFGHRLLADHALYQRVVATEPELILPLLTVESHRIRQLIVEYLRPWVVAEGVPDGEATESLLDYLSRMVLSFIDSPGGWDMTDREAVGQLVRSRFLAPVAAAAASA